VAGERRPGHAKALSLTTRTSHAPAEACLADVSTPTLVIMGDADPDFADQRAEGDWIAEALHGQVVMIPEAGHRARRAAGSACRSPAEDRTRAGAAAMLAETLAAADSVRALKMRLMP
jgi:hypothetical protein